MHLAPFVTINYAYSNCSNLMQADLSVMPRKRKLPKSLRQAPRTKTKKKRSSNVASASTDGNKPIEKMKLAELKAALKAAGAAQNGSASNIGESIFASSMP